MSQPPSPTDTTDRVTGKNSQHGRVRRMSTINALLENAHALLGGATGREYRDAQGSKVASKEGGAPELDTHRDMPQYRSSDVNYKKRYAPDPYGEEVGPKARVWSVYNDEAKKADNEMTKGMNETIKTLFLFAGLFSAVVTTFVAQSSLRLELDYAKITASLVYESVLLQRATAAGKSVEDIPASQLIFGSETHRTTDIWVNGLWLTSLTLSLLTALICVLARQWIQYFNTISGRNPRERAQIRQYRVEGFRRWNVPFIVDLLPLLLSAALLLFLAGLAVYTTPGNLTISFVIIGFSSTVTIIYAVSLVLPIFVTDCPYKTPISGHIPRHHAGPEGNKPRTYFEEREFHAVNRKRDTLSERALAWLCTTSNTSAVIVAGEAAFAQLTRNNLAIHTPSMRFIVSHLLPFLNDDLETIALGRLRLGRWITLRTRAFLLPSLQVVRMAEYMRDHRHFWRRGVTYWRQVQHALTTIINNLGDLSLHPIVWRDLELSVHHCRAVELRLTTEPLNGYRELAKNAKGNPLEYSPVSLTEYNEGREGKGTDEVKFKADLEYLAKKVSEHIARLEDKNANNGPPPRSTRPADPADPADPANATNAGESSQATQGNADSAHGRHIAFASDQAVDAGSVRHSAAPRVEPSASGHSSDTIPEVEDEETSSLRTGTGSTTGRAVMTATGSSPRQASEPEVSASAVDNDTSYRAEEGSV